MASSSARSSNARYCHPNRFAPLLKGSDGSAARQLAQSNGVGVKLFIRKDTLDQVDRYENRSKSWDPTTLPFSKIDDSRLSFLDLPAEVRDICYEYLIDSSTTLTITNMKPGGQPSSHLAQKPAGVPSIFSVSKELNSETAKRFYDNVTVHFLPRTTR